LIVVRPESAKKVLLAPSIASAEQRNLERAVRIVEDGDGDLLHFDLEDGVFIPNITFGPSTVRSLRPLTSLPFDVHVELQSPEMYLEEIVEAGADRVTVHLEACPFPHRTLTYLRSLGVSVGIAYNAMTPIAGLGWMLDLVDVVHLMTADPDRTDARFIPAMLDKIRETAGIVGSRDALIEVDGGISFENVREVIAAGADILVIGRAIWRSEDPVAEIRRFGSILAGSPEPPS
jgi:ribulose-phosphate 3-epimerase